ncbi:hypothetical protein CsSME_00040053 [Camellia sinensis var. sinensis]
MREEGRREKDIGSPSPRFQQNGYECYSSIVADCCVEERSSRVGDSIVEGFLEMLQGIDCHTFSLPWKAIWDPRDPCEHVRGVELSPSPCKHKSCPPIPLLRVKPKTSR